MNKISVSTLLCGLFCLASIPTYAERKPLPRPTLKRIEHQPTGTRLRYNPKTKQSEEYELAGKIIYDEKTGNFLLRWRGMDGRRKTIIYEPATRLDAVVIASVGYDSERNAYRYSYVLSNLPTSKQKLQTYFLETQAVLSDVKAPDTTWYSTALTTYLQDQFKIEGGWIWAQTMGGNVGLLPGQTVSGMLFLSPGLPSVVKCYVRHYAKLRGSQGEEIPEELHAAIDRVAWKIPQGVTVGPVAPPERVNPAAFASKILGMLDVSVKQGWIESPRVAQEMQALLQNAVTALERGDTLRASDHLRRLLRRVEEENTEGTLLSEAYALLRFNVEFLLTHIDGK